MKFDFWVGFVAMYFVQQKYSYVTLCSWYLLIHSKITAGIAIVKDKRVLPR